MRHMFHPILCFPLFVSTKMIVSSLIYVTKKVVYLFRIGQSLYKYLCCTMFYIFLLTWNPKIQQKIIQTSNN